MNPLLLLGLAGAGAIALLATKSASASSSSASTPAPWSPGLPNPAAYPPGGWSATTSPGTPAAGGGSSDGYPYATGLAPGGEYISPDILSYYTQAEAQAANPGATIVQATDGSGLWGVQGVFNPPSSLTAAGRVGAGLMPYAHHVGPVKSHPWWTPPTPIPPAGGGDLGGGPVPVPVGAGAVPGTVFDSTLWAWLAWGSTAPSGAPEPDGGSWVLVSALGPDGAAALYPSMGVIYSPMNLPVWVWYPTAGGLYAVGPGTSNPDYAGTNILVLNAPTPPPAGGSPATYLEMFPGYWVNAEEYAAMKSVTPPGRPPAVPPSPVTPSASVRHHHRAVRLARFDPMSGRHY